ncbi:hypothetical protein [Paraglaciecola marina]|uniref:hypothetical protein n=1 Tax=Paraglaciecola marina TaxID=2500157 RepID=UPI00105D7F34|nr:hypothetical protein [Paraglaciecola marina]
MNINTKICSANPLDKLINSCGTHKDWIKVILANPCILTDELSKHGLTSNNAHNITQNINPILFKLGYWIAVHDVSSPSKSWAWKLVTINQALKLPIHIRTRVRLEELILESYPRESANDE